MMRYLSIAFAAFSISLISLFSYAMTVGPNDIKTGAVRSKHIKYGQVKSRDIRNGGVRTQDLADGSVTTAKMADETVTTAKIAANAVHTTEIADGAVTTEKLATAVAVGHTPDTLGINTIVDTEKVTSITLDLPGPGTVVVFSSGYFKSTTAGTTIACSITKTDDTENDFKLRWGGSGLPGSNNWTTFSGTRGFDEAAAGPVTYNFVCSASSESPQVDDAIMTAIYSPSNITAGA